MTQVEKEHEVDRQTENSCVCVCERERDMGGRQKCTPIAEGKVTERTERAERDNKLVEGG